MGEVAVSNTSPILILSRAGLMRVLLDAFESVAVPEEVASEVMSVPLTGIDVIPLEARMEFEQLSLRLDRGEAAAICLARQRRADWVVLDDKAGRRAASDLGLRVIGTLGLVVAARQQSRIPNAREAFQRISDAGLYLSPGLTRRALILCGEEEEGRL